MKIALVIDFLTQRGGAEWTLQIIHSMFPEAPIYTLYYDPEQTLPYFRNVKVVTSAIVSKFPFLKKHWRKYLPIYPFAIEKFDFSKYDLVISVSFLFAKSIIVPDKTRHICYCLTPMRQAWNPSQMEYRFITQFIWWILRVWDIKTADRPTKYIAISNTVAERIKRIYKLQANVVYPPVDTDFFRPVNTGLSRQDFFLVVSRLVPYKRVDIVIKAFNEINQNLKIVGTGREQKRLKRLAKKNIEFLGEVSKEELLYLYNSCTAVICPQEEDFGIVAAEAQSCGKPVITFRKGGVSEIVIDGKTGIFFEEQSPGSLIQAIKKFESVKFDTKEISEFARERFNIYRFKKKLLEELK